LELESEGNADALSEPIIVSAVHSYVRDQRTSKGLDWLAAFDQLPLRAILDQMRGFEFTESELRQYCWICISRKLWKIFGPDDVVLAIKSARGRLRPGRPRRQAPQRVAA
jgi:hypothetical protein